MSEQVGQIVSVGPESLFWGVDLGIITLCSLIVRTEVV